MEPIKEIKQIDSGIRFFGVQNIGVSNNRVNQIRFANVRKLDIPVVENRYDDILSLPQAPPVTADAVAS